MWGVTCVDIKQNNGVVYLSGDISEASQFANLPIASGEVRMDMAGIRSINSTGVREWALWLGRSSIKPTYVNCPPAVVMQLNIIPQLLENGAVVESFYLPAYCPSCQKQILFLLRSGHEFFPGKAPTIALPLCGCDDAPYESDVDLDEYFYFVEQLPA